MVMSGPDDREEPEPEPEPGAEPGPGPAPELSAGHAEPGDQGSQESVPSWPASGLPPSFGQRSTEGERPPVVPPGPGSGYGGYRPLGSLPPSGPPPGGPPPGGPSPGGPAWPRASDGWPGPEVERHEPDGGHDEYGPGPGAEADPQAAFG